MTCSCKNSSTVSSCGSKDSCGCSSETIINPLSIEPITTSDAASDKWSVETTVKPRNGISSQSSKYAGQISGATNQEKVLAIHVQLTEIVTDIIRSVTSDSYTGPQPFLPTLEYENALSVGSPILEDIVAFQNYFTNSNPSAPTTIDPQYVEVTDTTHLAYINYISQMMYQVYQSIERHIDSASVAFSICPSGSPRLIKIAVDNCLICFTLIYN